MEGKKGTRKSDSERNWRKETEPFFNIRELDEHNLKWTWAAFGRNVGDGEEAVSILEEGGAGWTKGQRGGFQG